MLTQYVCSDMCEVCLHTTVPSMAPDHSVYPFFTNVSISSGGLNLKPKCAALLVDCFILVILKVIGSSQFQI